MPERTCHIRQPLGSFNPLPTRRSEDAWRITWQRLRLTCFNPLPTRRSEDASRWAGWLGWRWCFNPLPTRRSEDAAQINLTAMTAMRFNPLPTRRSEDAYSLWSPISLIDVSIHFRPEGRKMQHCCNSIKSLLFLDY